MGTDRVNNGNGLDEASTGRLIFRYAMPAVLGNLVDATYNIADQIFIGHGVGMLGNAATNVAFPLVTICTALSLLLGVGAASNFSLAQGRGNKARAAHMAGNGIAMALGSGIVLALLVMMFLRPMLGAFGATENVLPLALSYTGITSLGIPFLIFKGVCSQLIRADGSPAYAMFCMVCGAILNIILDPIFIFALDMGMAGAAWATVIGQGFSALMALLYLRRFRTVRLTRGCFAVKRTYVRPILSLGAAASINQVAITIVYIAMNNMLTVYGAASHYGSDIPLAVAGVIAKANVIFMSFTIGLAQGCQPIFGFNYGAGRYDRVKRTFVTAAVAVTLVSTLAYACFQLFPREIVSIFGHGGETYMMFAERYLSIYMALLFLNGIQPLASNFFTSIGKASRGVLLSLTRQIVLRLPLILVLPRFIGVEWVLYAGPVSDGVAFVVAVLLLVAEFRRMGKLPPSKPVNVVTDSGIFSDSPHQ